MLNLSRQEAISTKLSDFAKLPEKPGVYILKNAEDKPVYVGKASSIRQRVAAHLRPRFDDPIGQSLKEQIFSAEHILTQSPIEALILENVLIKKHKPRYNIRLKDDKSYPYIKVTVNEPVPRVLVTRRVVDDGGRYFGPYGNARAARRTVKFLRRVFPIRGCTLPLDGVKKFRVCIDYSIGLCKAPCIFAVTEQEYNRDVKKFQLFLEGKLVQLSKVMYDEMWKASEAEEYERASKIRDEIRSLETTALRQRISFSRGTRDKDVVTVARDEQNAAAIVFEVREGNVIGSEKFLLEGVTPSFEDAEVLSAFLKQHYASEETRARGYPEEIVVPMKLNDSKEIEAMIEEAAGTGSKSRVIEEKHSNKAGNYVQSPKGAISIDLQESTRMASPKISPASASPVNAQLMKLAQENALSLLKERESRSEEKRRERLRALKELKEKLGLSKIPRRIECFDISNIRGNEAVGAMTVFTDGFPDKNQYRKFQIKTVHGIDDYSMMAEMISRRIRRLIDKQQRTQACENDKATSASVEEHKGKKKNKKEDRWARDAPDLVVIDGGRGHLNAALEQMRRDGVLGIPTIALAKREEIVFLPDRINPLILPKDSEALHVLQHVRDTAHRFGITYHRRLRASGATRSALDDVPGIGEKRKRNLLAHFGSVEAIRRSSPEEISQVGKISKKLADSIVSTLAK
ncbi:MAG TPA: excinuclease ABC subunit UvrC [Nitrososphaerales archaeon]|nr:excinuclease ABC subunit UvrC [Nitrososphaerales archaeon]